MYYSAIKTTLTFVVSTTFMGILTFFMPTANAYNGVTILLSAETATNQEFVEHFKSEMMAHKANHLRVTVINIQDEEKVVVAENSELVIALGVKALDWASKLRTSTPVIGVFTPLPTFNALLNTSKRELGNFSAIVLDQPYSRQVALIRLAMPDAKNLGVLLGNVSSQQADTLNEAADKNAFNLIERLIYTPADLIPKLKNLLHDSDALLAIPDPAIYSRETAQPILLTSYRHAKPVFGYSLSYVRAGALAAVYSTTKQLAKQAVEMAIESKNTPDQLPAPQTPQYFSVAINQQVARALNLVLPSEVNLLEKLIQLESDDEESH